MAKTYNYEGTGVWELLCEGPNSFIAYPEEVSDANGIQIIIGEGDTLPTQEGIFGFRIPRNSQSDSSWEPTNIQIGTGEFAHVKAPHNSRLVIIGDNIQVGTVVSG